MGPAIANGGITTFLALLLLGFSESHIFITFFKVGQNMLIAIFDTHSQMDKGKGVEGPPPWPDHDRNKTVAQMYVIISSDILLFFGGPLDEGLKLGTLKINYKHLLKKAWHDLGTSEYFHPSSNLYASHSFGTNETGLLRWLDY